MNLLRKEEHIMRNHKKKHLILIGMMGTGKSTIGPHLASLLAYPYVDLDQWIENQQRLSINQIFEKFGELYFRRLESQALQHFLGQNQSHLLITGGGIVLRPEHIQWMKENGVVFHLQAEVETLIRRLEQDQSRPLLYRNVEDRIRGIWNQRKSLYESVADYQIHTDDRSVESITQEILFHWYQLSV